METIKEQISNEGKRIEVDSLWSAKGHFHTARLWNYTYYFLGGIIAILSAISGGTAFSDSEVMNIDHSILAGGIAFLVTALTGIMTFLNPSKASEKHLFSGNSYNALKNKARIFYTIEIPDSSELESLKEKLNQLDDQRNNLNLDSPPIPNWAYKKAKESIEINKEHDYGIDAK